MISITFGKAKCLRRTFTEVWVTSWSAQPHCGPAVKTALFICRHQLLAPRRFHRQTWGRRSYWSSSKTNKLNCIELTWTELILTGWTELHWIQLNYSELNDSKFISASEVCCTACKWVSESPRSFSSAEMNSDEANKLQDHLNLINRRCVD